MSGASRVAPAGVDPLHGFGRFMLEWLRPYGTVRREYFHLYLAEVVYRFNRRGQPLEAQLLRLMQRRAVRELRPLLVRKRWVERGRRSAESRGAGANLAPQKKRRAQPGRGPLRRR